MKMKISKSFLGGLIYICMLLAYFLQTSYLPTQNSMYRKLILFLYFIAYFIGFYKLITQKWNKKGLFISICFLLVGFCTYIANKDIDFLIAIGMFNVLFMLICSKSINIDCLCKIDVVLRSSFTVLLYYLTKIGYLHDVTTMRNGGIIRHSLGYAHPNRFGAAIFIIVLYTTYLRRKKIGFKDLCFQIVMFLIVVYVSDSRNSAIGILVVCLYTFFVSIKKLFIKRKNSIKQRYKKIIEYTLIGGAILLIIVTVYMCINYNTDNVIMKKLNLLFNTRIELGNMILSYYKPTLFGQGIQTYSWEDVLSKGLSHSLTAADILYIYIYTNYGIVSLVIYIFILIQNIKIALHKDNFLVFVVILISVISCVENQYLAVGSNIFILLFSDYLYNRKKVIEGKI